MDNPSVLRLFPDMAQIESPKAKLVTPASLAIDAILVAAFFVFMYAQVSPHVPSNDPHMIMLWGAITASCLTAVFWLSLQMFRVTLRAQRAAKKK
jgi:hypothetical protein